MENKTSKINFVKSAGRVSQQKWQASPVSIQHWNLWYAWRERHPAIVVMLERQAIMHTHHRGWTTFWICSLAFNYNIWDFFFTIIHVNLLLGWVKTCCIVLTITFYSLYYNAAFHVIRLFGLLGIIPKRNSQSFAREACKHV